MAPLAPQGAVKLAPAIPPIDGGMPGSAPSDANGFAGDRIMPVIPPSVPGASRMTR